MLSYRLGAVNDFHWGFKAIENLTLSQHMSPGGSSNKVKFFYDIR